MRIARVRLLEYELPLLRPLRIGGAESAARSGVIVVLEDGTGRTGMGEAAPLPGLHTETLAEARDQLLRFAGRIEGTAVPPEAATLRGAFEGWLGPHGLTPSVRCGVEGAALALLAEGGPPGMPELVAGLAVAAVHVNALLAGDDDVVVAEARRLAAEGWRCLKIKVGRGDPDREAALVAAVRRAVGAHVALRLDANRSWDLPTATTFAQRVSPERVEYLEEPLRDSTELPALFEAGGVAVALDETLLSRSPDDPGDLRGVAAFVLKPAVLGGYERAMAWSRCAAEHGIAPVVSAAFPSAAGLALDAAFAAAVAPELEHGLGTFAAFAADIARTPVAAPAGVLELGRLPRSPDDLRPEACRVIR